GVPVVKFARAAAPDLMGRGLAGGVTLRRSAYAGPPGVRCGEEGSVLCFAGNVSAPQHRAVVVEGDPWARRPSGPRFVRPASANLAAPSGEADAASSFTQRGFRHDRLQQADVCLARMASFTGAGGLGSQEVAQVSPGA